MTAFAAGFCNTGLNTGQTCTKQFGVQNKFILCYTYNSAGVLNEIDVTTNLNGAYWTTAINNSDISTRLYPLPKLENITDLRADPLFKTWDSGAKDFVQQGIRTVMGYATGRYASPQMEGKINGQRDLSLSYYIVDKNGNLKGKRGSTATKLAPIQIQDTSLYAVFNPTVDKENQTIKIGFDIDNTERDKDIWVMEATIGSTTGLSFNLNKVEGLYDVTPVITSITDSSFSIQLITDGGSAGAPFTVKNLPVTDFISTVAAAAGKIRRINNTPADVTLTLVSESPLGTYNFTIPTGTTGDILTPLAVLSGYDFSTLPNYTITLP